MDEVIKLEREAGFDAAIEQIEEWAPGFYSSKTRGMLQAVARDLRTHKADILDRIKDQSHDD